MKCEKCGNKMENVFQIEYKLTGTTHDYFICNNVDCQHCLKKVYYIQEVTGKEKERVLECRAGMQV